MKHILTAALSAAFLLSCSNLKKDNEPNEPVVTNERLDALKKKQADYCQWSKERYETRGYVHSKCDGLLFTSLHSLSCDYVSIDDFQKSSGLWKRSPSHDCFSTGGSRTGVSGDMLYGVLLHAWQYDRTDIIADLIEYGEANDWDMCGGEHESEAWRIGRCVVKPGLKSTIYLVGNALGLPCDKKCRLARSVPLAWNPHAKDFEAHLVQLSFLLRGLAEGALNDNQIAQLRYQAERVPKNGLFQAQYALWKTGDFSKAFEIAEGFHFPDHKLPDNKFHKSGYLWERDPGPNWEPDPEAKTHDGTDFLFLSAILLGELRGQNGTAGN